MKQRLIPVVLTFLAAAAIASAAPARPTTKPATTEPVVAFPIPPLPDNWDGGFYVPSPNVEPHPARGVYAIWYTNWPELLDLPFLKGGQVMEQWATIEPEEGKYDFSALDKKLDELAKRDFYTTLQVNGNSKPEWLFDKVPYYPDLKNFSKQISDQKGALMYWHPEFERHYFNFVKALANYIKNSPHKDRIIGLRMNFNSIGTEMTDIPPEARNQKGWIIPEGVDPGPFPWTFQTGEKYMQKVVDEHVKEFEGVTRIFIRSYVGSEIKDKYKDYFNTGKLSWFFTGMSHVVFKWRTSFPPFFLDVRTGETLGYGEPGANAWGHRTESKKPKEIPPVCANYWTVLLDLHMGVSFVACYGSDLLVAYDGRLPGPPNPIAKVPATKPADGQYVDMTLKPEFRAAFEFAAKYAGYHASPEQSPGAWIALRQISDTDDRKDTWDVMSNDCTFLMKRIPDNSIPVKAIGPDNSRFHAYARQLPKGETMNLVLDPLFVKSLAEKPAKLNLTYFDGPKGSVTIEAAGQSFNVELKNSSRWQTTSFDIPQANFVGTGKDADIVVTAGQEEDVILHMVEITKEQ